MNATQAPATKNTDDNKPASETKPPAIPVDLTALAGAPNSLGAQSTREVRPATDDSIVEAMDEAGPGVTAPLVKDKAGN